MRRLILVSAVLVATAFLVVSSSDAGAQTQPNPTTCEGYPENRVYLENQSWLDPQTGLSSHPGTGKQGHIHIATCFPLYQTLTDDTLSLDIRMQLHNVPGLVASMFVRTYQMGGPTGSDYLVDVPSTGPCNVADCDRWIHVDFPLGNLTESGQTEFQIFQRILNRNADGTLNGKYWYNMTRWWFEVDNGAPPRTPPITNLNQIRIGGDTWLTGDGEPGGSNYAEAIIDDDSIPWNFETGDLIPVSGTWSPKVWMNGDHGQVLLDPSLHAVPVNHGIEVWSGVPVRDVPNVNKMTIDIDTTELVDGLHKMLLISCDDRPTGAEHCGVLVVPFVVANGNPPTVVNLSPGEELVVNCPTSLSGSVEDQEANLTCSG